MPRRLQLQVTPNFSASRARIRRGRILKLAFFLAALGQDIAHTGYTNDFEVKSNSTLAVRYIDNSPLEYHHCAFFFKILLKTKIEKRGSKAKVNLVHFLTKKEYSILREFVLFMVLKTDPKYHSQFIELFEYQSEQVELEQPPSSSEYDVKLLEKEKTQNENIRVGAR